MLPFVPQGLPGVPGEYSYVYTLIQFGSQIGGHMFLVDRNDRVHDMIRPE